MKAILKVVAVVILPLALLGCEAIYMAGNKGQPDHLQKRLTFQHSDAVTVGLIDRLIKKEQPLLFSGQVDPDGWPLPSVDTVVLYEQRLCQLEKEKRMALLNRYKSGKGLAETFETLLLASCAPDYTPAILAMSIKQICNLREWPASYMAYFDLLERHQQALLRLEKLYGNLKERMDTTIDKLTEIEVETQP